MNNIRKAACIVTAILLLVTAVGCKSTEAPDISADKTTTSTKPTAPTGVPVEENIITGNVDMNGTTLSRPIGVMVANNDFIQDEQVGLAQADLWVEAETEGGITRMMAVFANSARVPAEIGPVRSARTPFAKIAEAFGLGYVHAGGSYTALDYIASSDIADLDVNGGDDGSAYSWRDHNYPHDYEYRLRTSGELLTKYMTDCAYEVMPVRDLPWTFDTQTGDPATQVDIMMSGAQTIGFEYNQEAGCYTKTNGSSKTPHVDSSGTAITPNTVLVLYTDKYQETNDTIDFYLQSGEGYVFSSGVMRRFDWTRDDVGFNMTEKDGTQLKVGAGKVYVCIVATDYESELSYE